MAVLRHNLLALAGMSAEPPVSSCIANNAGPRKQAPYITKQVLASSNVEPT